MIPVSLKAYDPPFVITDLPSNRVSMEFASFDHYFEANPEATVVETYITDGQTQCFEGQVHCDEFPVCRIYTISGKNEDTGERARIIFARVNGVGWKQVHRVYPGKVEVFKETSEGHLSYENSSYTNRNYCFSPGQFIWRIGDRGPVEPAQTDGLRGFTNELNRMKIRVDRKEPLAIDFMNHQAIHGGPILYVHWMAMLQPSLYPSALIDFLQAKHLLAKTHGGSDSGAHHLAIRNAIEDCRQLLNIHFYDDRFATPQFVEPSSISDPRLAVPA